MSDAWWAGVPDPAPGYSFCTSGRALAVCRRCGAIICSEDASFDLHDAFHASIAEKR